MNKRFEQPADNFYRERSEEVLTDRAEKLEELRERYEKLLSSQEQLKEHINNLREEIIEIGSKEKIDENVLDRKRTELSQAEETLTRLSSIDELGENLLRLEEEEEDLNSEKVEKELEVLEEAKEAERSIYINKDKIPEDSWQSLDREVERMADVLEEQERYDKMTLFEKEEKFRKECLDQVWKFFREARKNNSPIREIVAESLAGLDPLEIEKIFFDRIAERFVGASEQLALAGNDSEYAKEIRLRAANFYLEGLMPESTMGLDDENTWLLRKNDMTSPNKARSLAGLDSKRAWEWRENPTDHDINGRPVTKRPVDFLRSLVGLDSERAWKMRREMAKKIISKEANLHKKEKMRSLRLLESYRISEKTRRELVKSVLGLESEEAWEWRKEYRQDINNKGDKGFLIESLAGLDSEEAWEWREEFIRENEDQLFSFETRKVLAKSLSGVDSPKAWFWREKYLTPRDGEGDRMDSQESKTLYISSLYGGPIMVAIRKARLEAA